MSDETKIIVTDELISKYRSRYELNARNWQDQAVKGYVVGLSSHLTIAKAMGWESTVTDITALLARFEPLENIRENDYGGHVLWIAYNWYVMRDVKTTHAAIEAALAKWPEDARLVRMWSQMPVAQTQQ